MITSASIQYVSKLFNYPHLLTDKDIEQIKEIKKEFPYFMPVHYMEAAEQHKKEAYAPVMLAKVQPYMGNWIRFCDLMDAAAKSKQTEREKATEAKAAIEDTVVPKVEEPVVAVKEEPAPVVNEVKSEPVAEEPAVEEQPEEEIVTLVIPEPIEGIPVEQQIEDAIAVADAEAEEKKRAAEVQLKKEEESLIRPALSGDYFHQQGINVSNELPESVEDGRDEGEKTLMVMMSFADWLLHFKTKSQKEQEENEDKKALKAMWQHEKLAAAQEEENDEIPENVFEMAVNSITSEDGLASESLAEIHVKQGKYDKAIEMYRKLSLRNPQKSAYFARKIEEVLKDKQL